MTTTVNNEVAVTIIGGGMVGLLLAAALAQAHIKVAVVEAKMPLLQWDHDHLDSRVSAINMASQTILHNLKVWSRIDASSYSSLMRLQVWDSVGGGDIVFDSADIGVAQLGAIVENRAIVRALWQQLQADDHVELICPAEPQQLMVNEHRATIILDNQRELTSPLVVGADGGHSWLRKKMDIALAEKPYDHSAVVAVVASEQVHQRTAWQAFLPDGVLALLPLANPHHCAMVWSVITERANDLVAMSSTDINSVLNNDFGLRLGELQLLNQARAIPLVMRHAKQYVVNRLALIGDAAHTIHPLAGQGVNLGFMDVACLAQAIIDGAAKQYDSGSLRVLRRYERWRKADNSDMLLAMRGFKELFASDAPLIVQARNLGLSAANRLTSVKKYFMTVAIGDKHDLPPLAQKS